MKKLYITALLLTLGQHIYPSACTQTTHEPSTPLTQNQEKLARALHIMNAVGSYANPLAYRSKKAVTAVAGVEITAVIAALYLAHRAGIDKQLLTLARKYPWYAGSIVVGTFAAVGIGTGIYKKFFTHPKESTPQETEQPTTTVTNVQTPIFQQQAEDNELIEVKSTEENFDHPANAQLVDAPTQAPSNVTSDETKTQTALQTHYAKKLEAQREKSRTKIMKFTNPPLNGIKLFTVTAGHTTAQDTYTMTGIFFSLEDSVLQKAFQTSKSKIEILADLYKQTITGQLHIDWNEVDKVPQNKEILDQAEAHLYNTTREQLLRYGLVTEHEQGDDLRYTLKQGTTANGLLEVCRLLEILSLTSEHGHNIILDLQNSHPSTKQSINEMGLENIKNYQIDELIEL